MQKEADTYKIMWKFTLIAVVMSFAIAFYGCGGEQRELQYDFVERVDTVNRIIHLKNGLELTGSDYTRMQYAVPGEEAFY